MLQTALTSLSAAQRKAFYASSVRTFGTGTVRQAFKGNRRMIDFQIQNAAGTVVDSMYKGPEAWAVFRDQYTLENILTTYVNGFRGQVSESAVKSLGQTSLSRLSIVKLDAGTLKDFTNCASCLSGIALDLDAKLKSP